jgi:hypothetical protein
MSEDRNIEQVDYLRAYGLAGEDMPLELGQQRLMISTNYGTTFAKLLEQEETPLTDPFINHQQLPAPTRSGCANVINILRREEEVQPAPRHLINVIYEQEMDKTAARIVRSFTFSDLIGCSIRNYGDNYVDTLTKLADSLGIPYKTPINERVIIQIEEAITDRLIGREDFIILFTNFQELSQEDQVRLTNLFYRLNLPQYYISYII